MNSNPHPKPRRRENTTTAAEKAKEKAKEKARAKAKAKAPPAGSCRICRGCRRRVSIDPTRREPRRDEAGARHDRLGDDRSQGVVGRAGARILRVGRGHVARMMAVAAEAVGAGRRDGGRSGGIAEARLTLDDFVRVAEHVGARRAEV